MIGWLATWLLASSLAIAEPRVPEEDSLTVLRVARSPEQQALTALERDVDARPSDPLALQALIDAYLRFGRHTAEPRRVRMSATLDPGVLAVGLRTVLRAEMRELLGEDAAGEAPSAPPAGPSVAPVTP